MLVVKIGGPAYRIGMGGGAASSVPSGSNSADLDFNAVQVRFFVFGLGWWVVEGCGRGGAEQQWVAFRGMLPTSALASLPTPPPRLSTPPCLPSPAPAPGLQRGDAEVSQKLWRVVRACVELGEANPIEQIHDQVGPLFLLSFLYSFFLSFFSLPFCLVPDWLPGPTAALPLAAWLGGRLRLDLCRPFRQPPNSILAAPPLSLPACPPMPLPLPLLCLPACLPSAGRGRQLQRRQGDYIPAGRRDRCARHPPGRQDDERAGDLGR